MFNWAQASLERAVGVAYEQRFRSLLAYVNDRPQAIEALLGGEVWADYYQSYFAEAAAYVEANGVEVTGALVSSLSTAMAGETKDSANASTRSKTVRLRFIGFLPSFSNFSSAPGPATPPHRPPQRISIH